ncbi:hypothetical protein EAO73_35500 [Streptomyces sp. col6]|uniref:hypothetical protein n=1 Tax=Streptomyces sp. col6 TaxID=2478958 RepID=UPI0011CE8EA6|nr:hypothetical protein [Streptomyces sp. col6]TXR91999.1 hypothetical protein EAO73_35500 [Streptomyces sp. col6]
MRFSGKALFTVGAASALMLLSPSIASAAYYGSETDYATSSYPADVDQHWEYIGITGVGVSFTGLGDWFKVHDTKKDGYAAVVEWHDVDGTRSGACVSKLGGGTSGGCNKNFYEGHEIEFRAALYNNGTFVRASAWTHSYA